MSYFTSHYAFTYRPAPSYYRLKAKQLFSHLARFRHGVSPRTLLDVGCGCGDLAEAVHNAFGLRVSGVDPDPRSIEMAKQKGVGDFHVAEIGSSQNPFEKKFDLITAFEVYEHLPTSEHARVFQICRSLANSNALGVIMVPNTAHPFLGGWLAWSDYTHRSCFTSESLAQMLRVNGVSDFIVFPWYQAGRPWLLRLRELLGRCIGSLFRVCMAALGTRIAITDPNVTEALPLSSHIAAVFQFPS